MAAVAARKLLENKFIKRFILEDVCIAKVGCSIIIYYLRFSLFLMGVMFRLGHLNKKKEIKTPEKTPPLPTLSQLQPPGLTHLKRETVSRLLLFLRKEAGRWLPCFFNPPPIFRASVIRPVRNPSRSHQKNNKKKVPSHIFSPGISFVCAIT